MVVLCLENAASRVTHLSRPILNSTLEHVPVLSLSNFSVKCLSPGSDSSVDRTREEVGPRPYNTMSNEHGVGNNPRCCSVHNVWYVGRLSSLQQVPRSV